MAARKVSTTKQKPGTMSTRARKTTRSGGAVTRGHVRTAENDNLSEGLADLVPDEMRGTDRFLDVVTWNLRWFNEKDTARSERVTTILRALNADVFVFEEIRNGSLAAVTEQLLNADAGAYEVAYGTTGGDQRVAIMYDLDWIRAKDDIGELFAKGEHKTSDDKEVFPRLPLRAYFTGRTEPDEEPFDFQLLGLHLKSQRGDGTEQREEAAQILADWLTKDSKQVDADVIMIGDWNAPPSADVWKPFRTLENAGKALFTSVNDEDDFSHLMYQSKTKWGSRLDLTAVSMASAAQLSQAPGVVRWKSLDELLTANPNANQLKAYIKEIRETVSDHLPVVSRYYFTSAQEPAPTRRRRGPR